MLCKYYKYSPNQLDMLFQRLIDSIFTCAIEVWGYAPVVDKIRSQLDWYSTGIQFDSEILCPLIKP